MKDVPISRVMTPAPATVTPTSTVAAAERLMREHRCHHVPVVENGRLVGMVGARDLMKALVLRGEVDTEVLSQGTLETLRVADVMQRNVLALAQTATLLDAARALANGELHAIPVVAPTDALAGIVTSTDVIETLVEDLTHPLATPESPEGDRAPAGALSTAQVALLRNVYRATLRYLESGCAELEHGRLLQAVNRARESLAGANVQL